MDSRSLDLFVKIILEIDEIESRKIEFHIDADLWSESRSMRDLLLMPLIQIGELTAHFKDNEHISLFPDIPWRDIKGFRNVMVHGYGQIDPDSAWETATNGIAELRSTLLKDQEILATYKRELELRNAFGNASDKQDINAFLDELPSVE